LKLQVIHSDCLNKRAYPEKKAPQNTLVTRHVIQLILPPYPRRFIPHSSDY